MAETDTKRRMTIRDLWESLRTLDEQYQDLNILVSLESADGNTSKALTSKEIDAWVDVLVVGVTMNSDEAVIQLEIDKMVKGSPGDDAFHEYLQRYLKHSEAEDISMDNFEEYVNVYEVEDDEEHEEFE